jgi:hypothetical protein
MEQLPPHREAFFSTEKTLMVHHARFVWDGANDEDGILQTPSAKFDASS